MPNKKEALMVQAVFAMAQGCGADAQIAEDACDWFVEHYHPWVETTKEVGKSPQDVWDQEGKGFLAKFKEIGRQAARDGVVDRESLAKAAESVERDSDCPYCPIKP
jgi:hypothetical protein